jgi:hypothetical protein
MRSLQKSCERNDVLTCEVNYDLPLDALITKERMGTLERERVFENLDHHKDKRGQKGKRTVRMKCFKPVKEMRLGTVLNRVRRYGRPATLREAITLCWCSRGNRLKKKISVIGCHGANQQSISLAYWFDGAWRLGTFTSNRIWKRTYRYEFVYVPK